MAGSVPRYLSALLSAALAATLAACSSAPSASTPPTASSAGVGARSSSPAVPSSVASPAASPSPAIGAAGPNAAALQQIVDAARQEGQLTFTWGAGTMGGGGGAGIQQLADAFNKYYGLNLSVSYTPGPSMPSMVSQVTQEYQANQPASSDLVVGYATHMLPLISAGVIQPVDWTSWAPNIQNPDIIAPNGVAVEWESSVGGIGYNTNDITGADIPTSLQDLLKPEFKGKIASTSYGANFDYLSTPPLWGREKTLSYLNQLSGQLEGLIRCDEVDRLGSSEFDLFGLTCSQSNVFQVQQKGAPVGFVVPSDAAMALSLYVAIPKNAVHPNAAELWVNYLLTRDTQDFLYSTDYADSIHVPGSKTAQQFSDLQAKGIQMTTINVQFVQGLDEKQIAQNRQDIQAILTGSGAPST